MFGAGRHLICVRDDKTQHVSIIPFGERFCWPPMDDVAGISFVMFVSWNDTNI